MPRAQSVLIVEDSYLLLEIVASLCAMQGVRVVEASTGEAALTILRAHGPAIDWLFTDINLPGLIDGWSVAQAFRAARPDGPVVYTSTDSGGIHAAKRVRGVPGGLFLRKPFQVREVEQMVRTMARATAGLPMRAAG
jgi:two-component system, OmpR family, response regulator